MRVTLGGDGGDELFGARAYLLADRLRAGHPLQAVAARPRAAGRRGPASRGGSWPGWWPTLPSPARCPTACTSSRDDRSRVGRRPAGCVREAARDLLASEDPLAWKRLDGPRWWAEIAHGLTRGVEEIGVFEHQRRRAASAGLEARHPLFDLDLVELCLRQPPLATFDRYRNRPVLRAAMAGLLPDAVRLRPQKALFDSVLVDCLTGPDGAVVRSLLSEPRGGAQGLRRPARRPARAVRRRDRQRREQPFQWMWQLWRLTTAECWLRAQADRAGEALSATLKASPARIALRPAPSPAAAPASYRFSTLTEWPGPLSYVSWFGRSVVGGADVRSIRNLLPWMTK